jgi:PBSX family phage portal protein
MNEKNPEQKSASSRAAVARETPAGMESSNKRVVKALIVGPRMKDNVTNGESKQIPTDDLMQQLIAEDKVLIPPFDALVLAMLPENNSELKPVVEVMEINIDGHGFHLDPRLDVEKLDDKDPGQLELKRQVAQERASLTNFFANTRVFSTERDSFTRLRRKTRVDLETTGNAYWEVIRSPTTGRIQGFNLIPSYQMWLGKLDEELVPVNEPVHEIDADGQVTINNISVRKRFRRFVQSRLRSSAARAYATASTNQVMWFKQFGDPRDMDSSSGEFFRATVEGERLPPEKRANEIIHWKLYSPRSPYGLPRFIGNLITLFGDRAAEEINYVTLKNNNIPSMALLVSNGQLTDATIDRLTEFVETQIQGSDNYSRFLVIEAEGAGEEGQDQAQVKVQMEKLVSEQLRDQMFQDYQKNNAAKTRRAFRIPAIFVGDGSDYNKSTVEEARKLTDEQVFKPERDEFDNEMNALFASLGARFHKFVSNGPNVTDDQDMIAVLMAAERTGGLTPAIARAILSDVMNRPLPPIDASKVDPDVPFSLQMAAAVKNQAAFQTGSPEVGSQVTALKATAGADATQELLAQLLVKANQPIAAEQLIEALVFNRDWLLARMEKALEQAA